MEIKKEIIINESIEKAWQVLGVEFSDAYKWSSDINHSAAKNTQSLNGSSYTERGCDIVGMGKIKEKLNSYSQENHSLSYTVYDGMPFMIDYAENNWKLTSIGSNKTKLEMVLKAELKGIMGFLMKPMMKMNFTKMADRVTSDYKYYVENGKPSPQKLKTLN